MERVIYLYGCDGRVVAKARTAMVDSDTVLKARMFLNLQNEARKGVDCRGLDFTGKIVESASDCWFDECNFTGATILDARGSTFKNAVLTGSTFVGNCIDMFMEGAKLTGVNASQAVGLIIAGYFENGDTLAVNRRTQGWWVSTTYKSKPYYYPTLEASAIAYTIADESYNRQIAGLMGNAMAKIRETEGKLTSSAHMTDSIVEKMQRDVRDLNQRTQAQSPVISAIPEMTRSYPGDVFNQQ